MAYRQHIKSGQVRGYTQLNILDWGYISKLLIGGPKKWLILAAYRQLNKAKISSKLVIYSCL